MEKPVKKRAAGVVMDKSAYLSVDDPSKLHWAAVDGENNSEVVALALENLKIKVAELRNGRHRAESNVDAITEELERLRNLLQDNSRIAHRDIDHSSKNGSSLQVAKKDLPLVSAKKVSHALGQQLTSLKKIVESLPVPVEQKRHADKEEKVLLQPQQQHTLPAKNAVAIGGKKDVARKRIAATHYHINLAHVPFLLSKNINPSHSSVAAIQQLVAALKSHNLLCKQMCEVCKGRPNVKHNIEGLMNVLQEEHSQCCRHRKQMEQKGSSSMSQGRMENLKRKIKIKADQIRKLQQLQDELSKINCEMDEGGSKRDSVAKTKRARPKIGQQPAPVPNLMRRAKIVNALLNAGDKLWD